MAGLLFFLIGLAFYFLIPQKGRTTIAFISNSVTLLSLDHEKNTLTIVPVPSNTYLNVAQGKGNLTISSVYKFDLISKQNGILLTQTLREFFGIPVDGWVNIPGFNIASAEDFLKFKDKKLAFFSPLPSSTNFSFLDLKRFDFNMGKIRPDKIIFLDLFNKGAFREETLADGSVILTVDSLNLEHLINDNFYEWKILEENLAIAVLNSSQKAGLAARAGRIIMGSGGKVVKTGESDRKVVNCVINTLPKDKYSYTISRFKKIFHCDVEEEMPEEARADIVITLGSAYEKEIYGP